MLAVREFLILPCLNVLGSPRYTPPPHIIATIALSDRNMVLSLGETFVLILYGGSFAFVGERPLHVSTACTLFQYSLRNVFWACLRCHNNLLISTVRRNTHHTVQSLDVRMITTIPDII